MRVSPARAGREATALVAVDWDRWLPLLIAVIAALQAVMQTLYFTEVRADDGQIVSWAQELQWGRLDQPTLLSNIAWLFAQIGVPPEIFIKFARQIFLVGAILLIRAALGRWTQDAAAAWIGALAITLVEDVRGKGATEFTHFTFVVFSMSLAFYTFIRLAEHRETRWYLYYGLAAALVFHSKYNGTLLIIVLALISFVDPIARKTHMDARIGLSFGALLLLAVPVLAWAWLNRAEVEGTFHKYDFEDLDKIPAWEALEAVINSVPSVAILVALAFVIRQRAPSAGGAGGLALWSPQMKLLARYCLAFTLLAVVMAVIADVGNVKRRWVIPGTLFIAVLGGLYAGLAVADAWRARLVALMASYWAVVNVWLFLR